MNFIVISIITLLIIINNILQCKSSDDVKFQTVHADHHQSFNLNTNNNEIPIRYDNYKLYTLKINTLEQFNVLRKLETVNAGNNEYVFLELPSISAIYKNNNNNNVHDIDLLISPLKLLEFQQLTLRYNIANELKINNFQFLIDNERAKIKPRAFGWTDYYSFDEIYQWLDTILEQFPLVLTEFRIGNSSEGRSIRGIKLSKRAGNPAIFIESNIHAREWITSATSTYLLNELLTSTDPYIQNMSETIDWYILPILNVDGFIYSHTMNRLWRKTRKQHDLMCYGSDANRNFDTEWMTAGASDYPCSDFFAGTAPFSESETRALSDYFDTIAQQVKIYIAFHSYGQYLALPYGHTETESPTHTLQMAVGTATANAIQQRFNTDYVVGSSSIIIYPTSGSSSDWIYDQYDHIKISYTIELRDRRGGPYGYVLPADQILPNCLEITDGMKGLVEEARRQGEL